MLRAEIPTTTSLESPTRAARTWLRLAHRLWPIIEGNGVHVGTGVSVLAAVAVRLARTVAGVLVGVVAEDSGTGGHTTGARQKIVRVCAGRVLRAVRRLRKRAMNSGSFIAALEVAA